MTGSVLRTAFDNIASHIYNLETVKMLVDDLESENLSFDAVIETLQKKIEDAEVTLRTDIRILINECRHLERRKNS